MERPSLPSPEDLPAGAHEARWRPLVRLATSVLVSGGLCELIWSAIPPHLDVRTTTIGFSTFADFDIVRYTDAYEVIGFAFPILALLTFALLSWRGPLRRSPAPGRGLLPLVMVDEREAADRVVRHPPAVDAFWMAARLALPAFTVTLEVSITQGSVSQGITFGDWAVGACYMATVVACSSFLHELVSPDHSFRDAVIRINSLASLLVVPVLYAVSSATTLTILHPHRVVHYPWLPLWLAVILTVAALLLRRRWVRAIDAPQVERNVLLWIVGPVLVFLLVAFLPDALGSFGAFDDSQTLSTYQLMFVHGLLPWHDLFLIHGILDDGFFGTIGILIFGDTRWGAAAGQSIYVSPAFWLATYYFLAYFVRRRSIVLVGVGALYLSGLLPAGSDQFLVVPIGLMLFAMALRSPTWARCAGFGAFVVASMILVPESTAFEIAFIPLVLVYELTTRVPGTPVSLVRTVRCLVGAGVTGLVFVVYLLATSSLGDFVQFYLEFSKDFAIANGIPVQWNMAKDLLATVCYFAPLTLWLLTVLRVGTKLVNRSRWTVRDWTMVAAATVAVLYDPKAIQRSDIGHDLEVFSACLPILLLWGLEAVSVLDRLARRGLAGLARRMTAANVRPRALGYPVSVLAVIVILVVAPVPYGRIDATAAYFHPYSPRPAPAVPHLGYTMPGTVDTTLITDLGEVIDRYAGPTASVMDFTNQLGLVYYIFNRIPSTRFYHIEEAVTQSEQRIAVDEIRRSNPPVVVYSSQIFGLPTFDGVPMMVREYTVSEYILDHYRPLVDVSGEVVFIRNDLARHAKAVPKFNLVTNTTDLYFRDAPECSFGDIFNFYPFSPTFDQMPKLHTILYFSSRKGTYHVILPHGTDLLDYHWVVITADRPLGKASFALSDGPGADPSHRITFDSLPSSGRQAAAMVSGCIQWHGYDANSLYITSSTPQDTTFSLSLVR
ncbi:MAG TPA: hypothetical protein VL961_07595 [Acidimicrobiales bacterium]|nr:hypothetical protein [Acidimicrobiales bacterium]